MIPKTRLRGANPKRSHSSLRGRVATPRTGKGAGAPVRGSWEAGPDRSLVLRNHQRDGAVDPRHLRRVLRQLLEAELGATRYDLAVHLLSSGAMAAANLRHLGHEGPTDVITFDYAESPGELHGELLICPAVARQQAREFNTHWMEEVVRYAVHGILHLLGYDDRTTPLRRRMKREEARLMRALADALNLRLVRKLGA